MSSGTTEYTTNYNGLQLRVANLIFDVSQNGVKVRGTLSVYTPSPSNLVTATINLSLYARYTIISSTYNFTKNNNSGVITFDYSYTYSDYLDSYTREFDVFLFFRNSSATFSVNGITGTAGTDSTKLRGRTPIALNGVIVGYKNLYYDDSVQFSPSKSVIIHLIAPAITVKPTIVSITASGVITWRNDSITSVGQSFPSWLTPGFAFVLKVASLGGTPVTKTLYSTSYTSGVFPNSGGNNITSYTFTGTDLTTNFVAGNKISAQMYYVSLYQVQSGTGQTGYEAGATDYKYSANPGDLSGVAELVIPPASWATFPTGISINASGSIGWTNSTPSSSLPALSIKPALAIKLLVIPNVLLPDSSGAIYYLFIPRTSAWPFTPTTRDLKTLNPTAYNTVDTLTSPDVILKNFADYFVYPAKIKIQLYYAQLYNVSYDGSGINLYSKPGTFPTTNKAYVVVPPSVTTSPTITLIDNVGIITLGNANAPTLLSPNTSPYPGIGVIINGINSQTTTAITAHTYNVNATGSSWPDSIPLSQNTPNYGTYFVYPNKLNIKVLYYFLYKTCDSSGVALATTTTILGTPSSSYFLVVPPSPYITSLPTLVSIDTSGNIRWTNTTPPTPIANPAPTPNTNPGIAVIITATDANGASRYSATYNKQLTSWTSGATQQSFNLSDDTNFSTYFIFGNKIQVQIYYFVTALGCDSATGETNNTFILSGKPATVSSSKFLVVPPSALTPPTIASIDNSGIITLGNANVPVFPLINNPPYPGIAAIINGRNTQTTTDITAHTYNVDASGTSWPNSIALSLDTSGSPTYTQYFLYPIKLEIQLQYYISYYTCDLDTGILSSTPTPSTSSASASYFLIVPPTPYTPVPTLQSFNAPGTVVWTNNTPPSIILPNPGIAVLITATGATPYSATYRKELTSWSSGPQQSFDLSGNDTNFNTYYIFQNKIQVQIYYFIAYQACVPTTGDLSGDILYSGQPATVSQSKYLVVPPNPIANQITNLSINSSGVISWTNTTAPITPTATGYALNITALDASDIPITTLTMPILIATTSPPTSYNIFTLQKPLYNQIFKLNYKITVIYYYYYQYYNCNPNTGTLLATPVYSEQPTPVPEGNQILYTVEYFVYNFIETTEYNITENQITAPLLLINTNPVVGETATVFTLNTELNIEYNNGIYSNLLICKDSGGFESAILLSGNFSEFSISNAYINLKNKYTCIILIKLDSSYLTLSSCDIIRDAFGLQSVNTQNTNSAYNIARQCVVLTQQITNTYNLLSRYFSKGTIFIVKNISTVTHSIFTDLPFVENGLQGFQIPAGYVCILGLSATNFFFISVSNFSNYIAQSAISLAGTNTPNQYILKVGINIIGTQTSLTLPSLSDNQYGSLIIIKNIYAGPIKINAPAGYQIEGQDYSLNIKLKGQSVWLLFNSQLYNTATISVAGTGVQTNPPLSPLGDGGSATLATLNRNQGVAVDSAGNIYIADSSNFRIRMVTKSSGIITTVAGTGVYGYIQPVQATNATLANPSGIAVDSLGTIYFADSNMYEVCKFTVGGNITVLVSETLVGPTGVAIDSTRTNLYIADTGNNVVKKLLLSNNTLTIVGSGFNSPHGVALDSTSTYLYIADTGNNVIKKVLLSDNTLTTVASNFNSPQGIALDSAGNIYVADTGNNRIVIIKNGILTTLVTGLNAPTSVAVNSTGTEVYVGDTGNNKIKLIIPQFTTKSFQLINYTTA